MSAFNPHSLEPFWDSWYIDSLIGEGSFGSVYKISREEFGTKYYCALKIISIPKTEAEEKQAYYDGMDKTSATSYFREIVEVVYKEISIMAELKGKTNIVSYEDHKIIQKQDAAGFHILIRMELLESLNDYALRHKLTNTDIVNLGKDLCTALVLCQKRNLIHRDIKPANIFVTSDGDFKLGDFGIARQLEGTHDGLSIKGTYAYMAPEVYLGNTYDERVDIYSLGMVLYYFLNNRKGPFSDTTTKVPKFSERQESLNKRFQGEKLLAPILASERLAEVILKACEHNPDNRYKTPEEFMEELESLNDKELVPRIIITEESYLPNESNLQNMPSEDEDMTQNLFEPKEVIAENDDNTEYINPEYESYVLAPLEDAEKVPPTNQEEHNITKSVVLKRLPIFAVVILFIIVGVIYVVVRNNPNSEDATLLDAGIDKTTEDETPYDESSEMTSDDSDLDDITPTPIIDNALNTEIPSYNIELDNLDLEDLSSIDNIDIVTSLSVSYNSINSLDELKDSLWLDYLNFQNNNITELDALRNMEKLTCLNIMNNQISDLSPISNLTSLEILILSNNKISEIDTLSNLISLTELRLDGNIDLTDITTLSNFENLVMLTLSDTDIKDISSLYDLKNLQLLDLSNTEISDEQIENFTSKVPECIVIQ